MKTLKFNIAAVIMLMAFCTNTIMAQSTINQVPNIIATAFKAKYPDAELKKTTISNETYTIKGKQDKQAFYATFDKNGQWVKTTSAVAWSWKLPADVKNSLRQSKYAAWRIDKLKKVETPNGEFYQVLVDNLFLQPDADHAAFADNYILEFKPGGELFNKTSISSVLLF